MDTLITTLDKGVYINYFDFSSKSITTVLEAGTWYKLSTNTTSIFSNNGLVHSNNRVTNTGGYKVVKMEGIISVSANNGNEIHASFFKNDSLIPCSEQSVVVNSGNKVDAIPFHCITDLQTGDYLEVWVKNNNSTQDITLDNINVIITKI